MNTYLKYFLILALLALVVIQFIRPEKNNEGYETVQVFENETKPTEEVAGILKNNCYDCHSNQTQYPWYAEVAPASYWLASHIKEAKSHFNVSAWDTYSVKQKDHKLEEFIEEVEGGEMPLDSYTWIHGGLSENDSQLLIQWATINRLQYKNQLQKVSK
mgnify:CR=1 FL=1|jgi:hypothetical protein